MIEAETSNQLYFQTRGVDQEAVEEYEPVFLQEQFHPVAIVSELQDHGGTYAGRARA